MFDNNVHCDGKIGLVDDLSLLNQELPGGEFNKYIGTEYIDMDYESLSFTYKGLTVRGYYSRDIVEVRDAVCRGSFTDGSAAVTSRICGQGLVLAVNTCLWYGYLKTKDESVKAFAKTLISEFVLSEYEISAPLKARFCENENEYISFIFNYSDQEVNGHILSEIFDQNICVKPNDVIILREEKDHA